MALKLSAEDSKSANGCGGFIKLRGEIGVSVEDMVPSFSPELASGTKRWLF